MRFLLSVIALSVFLFSCSRDSVEPLWEPQSHLGSKDYQGGIFPVWITLKDPVRNASSISWKTGHSTIAYRSQGTNNRGLIHVDTVFLHWEAPPPIRLDSVDISKGGDTTKTWRIDTSYVDTIFAIVDGLRSEPIVIDVKNILPIVKSITIGNFEQPGDSLLIIAAHLGDSLNITLRLEKPFNKKYAPIVEMPGIFDGSLKLLPNSTDSLYAWKWFVPNKNIDSITYLRIKDKGGYGERLYKVHLIVYKNAGSVWAASDKEIVKYSPTGSRVLRISDNFTRISDIAVNSNYGWLFVLDQPKNIFAVYDTYGNKLYRDSTLVRSPSSIAVGIESSHVWIADDSGLCAYKFSGIAIESTENICYDNLRELKGISYDQYLKDFVWFAMPDKDTVGFVGYSNTNPEYIFINDDWIRPSMVSQDPVKGTTWIADSSRIVAIGTDGNILASITGFGFVSAVSAGNDIVWASDISRGLVYFFKGPFKSTKADLELTVANGMRVEGFSAPSFVSTYVKDSSAWVMDRGSGMAIRVDKSNTKTAFGTGLIPVIGKTIQIVE